MATQRELRHQYLCLHRDLTELLSRHDPVGLVRLRAPSDEYEPEVSTIIPRLTNANGPDDVRKIVHQEFMNWFESGGTSWSGICIRRYCAGDLAKPIEKGVALRKLAYYAAIAAAIFIFQTAHAQTLSGTVTNGTTNKPAAGDEVILINIANGMDVAGSTKADSAGKFSFKLTEPEARTSSAPSIRESTIIQFAPPGTSHVDVKVYDVSKKVDGLSLTADVLRLQADKTSLQGMRLFAVDNNSSPPVTQMNDHNFEFYLPAGAKVEQVQAKAPNGQPIPAEAVPQKSRPLRHRLPAAPRRNPIPTRVHASLHRLAQSRSQAALSCRAFRRRTPKVDALCRRRGLTAFKSMNDPNRPTASSRWPSRQRSVRPSASPSTGTGTISDQPARSHRSARRTRSPDQ